MLEPWGWHNEEYLTAILLAKLHNVNSAKKRDMKNPSDFIRDMQEAVLKEVQSPMIIDDDITEEEKQKVIAQVKKDFGLT